MCFRTVSATTVCAGIAAFTYFFQSEPFGDSSVDTGIKLIGGIDENGRQKFAIVEGDEHAAATYSMQQLDTAEIMLVNSEDEEGEGATSIRKTAGGFEARNGGHGWQGKWVSVTNDEIRQRIVELAPDNFGGHWSAEGTIHFNTGD